MKIRTIDAWMVKMPLAEPYVIAYETVDAAVNVFISIQTDTGLVGYGCAAPDEKITHETPDGIIDLKVPAGSRSGGKLRLKGRGIPGNPPGDIYAVLKIVLPEASNDQARELYQQMKQQLGFNPREGLGV